MSSNGQVLAYPRPLVAWYAVFMLSLANALSFIARTILSLLVDPIKADLHVSDTAVSLLQGFSFALIFAFMGLPIALLADRGNRRNIIALSILVWSVLTAVCGLAHSYPVLFVSRVGAGAGEGGFGPASQAVLADLFPLKHQPLAMAIYSLGIYVGSGTALIAGGAVIHFAIQANSIVVPLIGAVTAWQFAFLMVGLPGIVLAALFLTVPEPVRHETSDAAVAAASASLADVGAHLRRHAMAYTGLVGGFSLHVLVGLGAASWTPAYMMRNFGMSPLDLGLRYGAIFLVCGVLGAVSGGLIGGKLVRAGIASGNAWVGFVGYGIEVVFGIGYAWASSTAAAYICIAGMNLFSAAAVSAGFQVVNEITPNRMRAQIGALFLFAINLLGAGLGPTVVALFADNLFTGTAALARSIALTSAIFGTLAIGLLGLLIRHYPTVDRTKFA